MDVKQKIVIGIANLISSSVVLAGAMGPISAPTTFHPMVAIQGGYTPLNAGIKFQEFVGSDTDVFTYSSNHNSSNTGFIGAFLGVEYPLPWFQRPGIFMQSGIEYNYFGQTKVNGINTVGIEPQTSTLYSFNYKTQTQQVLGLVKLMTTFHDRFYPYGEVGLGAAFNSMKNFNAATSETGSINLTPTYRNNTNTDFSYILGLGVDAQVAAHIRIGLGYRYSNFGSSSFSNGVVIFKDYQAPVPFAPGNAHVYANQLLARISYVV